MQRTVLMFARKAPRLETPAEIRKYASFGSDLVGMTLIPEVFLAKELEMCYASICYVTNYAESIVDSEYRPGELFERSFIRQGLKGRCK